jgi:THO complex subunit 1
MVSLAPNLKSLIKSTSDRSVDAPALDSLVQKVLDESNNKVSIENRKSQWEYLLKNEVFSLAVRIAGSSFERSCP